jgi:hypothetical protein
MTLLATSTPAHRNPVRILVYGQSITKQEWSQDVYDFCPDLIIFHDFGGQDNYTKIIEDTRCNTTADILMHSSHPLVPDRGRYRRRVPHEARVRQSRVQLRIHVSALRAPRLFCGTACT